jgi:predicted Ser/Thr protein kinase
MMPTTPEFLALQAALAGEYSLTRELGRGGMGVVYLARDVQLDRDVAIKVLPGHLAARREDRERFLREARTAAGLSHPHIVPIHRVGEADGFVFFVMMFVPGETLGERLRRGGPLPATETMRVMREVAWALAHAHGRGIVHRDVKPDNILLEEETGRVLVTDFGIAWRGNAVATTDPGRLMGTAHFMSPEQGSSLPVDGRSDLYSLGVVGYLASSGRLPFEGASLPALLLKQSTGEPPALAAVSPGLPLALVRAVERCLRVDRDARFSGGEALAAALAPGSEGRPGLPAPLRRWLNARNPAQWAFSAWSGVTGVMAVWELITALQPHRHAMLGGVPVRFALILAPLVPILAFHVTQARRLYRAGYTLDDLRRALAESATERHEQELLEGREPLTVAQHLLRGMTYLSAAATVVVTTMTDIMFANGNGLPLVFFTRVIPGVWIVSTLLLVAMTMAEVPILPRAIRRLFRVGVRERLWNSRLGAWVTRRLGAPVGSHSIGAGVFRATETVLGAAAGDLFAALPQAQRDLLVEVPRVVRSLEARAVSARAEIERLEVAPHAVGIDASAGRMAAARTALGQAVAALEGIRLDLLRLHAGANDLAPLTTLIEAARLIGDDVSRLADAQRAAEQIVAPGRVDARRVRTPT